MFVLATDRPRFTVIAMSRRASGALGTDPFEARGRALAEALWITAPDEAGLDRVALTASLERVIRTAKPEVMPLRRCHITPPAARRAAEAPRWWSIILFPMLGADGRVTHIVQRLEDVTGTAQMQLVQDLWPPSEPEPHQCVQRESGPSMGPADSGVITLPRGLRAVDRDSPSLLLIGMREHESEYLRSGLQELGHRVIWAGSEHEALEICARQHPECVLLDLNSPDHGILRMCRTIREQPGCAEAVILCLAERRDAALVDRALLAGADDLLEKPITPRELKGHVQAALLLQAGISEPVITHCRKLRRQRMRLCSLQQQRERIAAYVVHDLKEPLGTIDLRAALLLLDANLPEQARTLVERIRTQVRAALLQVLNLLDIRMLDEGQLEARRERVDLFALVRELLTDFDVRAQARALTLHSDIAVAHVFVDPDLLRRVLANLLDNAIRHAPNNSIVVITARRIDGRGVELRVLDTGASIPADMTERVFDAYVQIEGAAEVLRRRTGRGLGLAFCKLAVQAHRGDISVSTIDQRTVFRITLPESAC